jgi:GAF domain-containing protein
MTIDHSTHNNKRTEEGTESLQPALEAPSGDVEEILQALLENALEAIQATHATIHLIERDKVVAQAITRAKDQPAAIPDLGQEAVSPQIPAFVPTRSELVAPLVVGGNVIGVLSIEGVGEDAFTQHDRDLLEGFVLQAASALHEASLFGSLEVSDTVPEAFLELQEVPLGQLTPDYLETTIIPYLKAICDIQKVLDELQRREHREVHIKAITYKSPISVSLDGAADAVQLARDEIVPWRRRHAESMACLLEQDKQLDIESKKAEILEKRVRAAKERVEKENLILEADKQREEVERMRLENEKLRLELQRAKIQLALDILVQVAPSLSEQEKIAYVVRLLPPLGILVSSELEISNDE